MAIDKRVANQELDDLLTGMSWHRNDLAAYRKKGDAVLCRNSAHHHAALR